MNIKEISIFGLYSQEENKVTTAFLQVLDAGEADLLRWILEGLKAGLAPHTIEMIDSQPAKDNKGSIPDGKIVCDNLTLFIESKLGCGISDTQMKRHAKLLKDPRNRLAYITNNPVRPEVLPEDVLWTNWEAVVNRLEAYQTSDEILRFLIGQFSKLIHSLFKEVDYYKKKGMLRVSDDVKVYTMTDAYNIFDADIVRRGFLVSGAADVPHQKGFQVWCSQKGSSTWDNQLTPDGGIYYESAKKDADSSKHVEESIAKGFKRIAFYQDKERFHDEAYHFIGVYELQEAQSQEEKRCVWKRIAEEWDLNKR